MGLCERCKKAQATFHLTDIDRSGAKVERHLCDKCAGEEGLDQSAKATVDLTAILENFVAGSKSGSADLSGLVCEECGISYYEFRNHGLLGCANDYEVFGEQIARLLDRTHDGASHHSGKVPRSLGIVYKPQRDIQRLRKQLDEAVVGEDYERAVELRDRIRGLESS